MTPGGTGKQSIFSKILVLKATLHFSKYIYLVTNSRRYKRNGKM
ncbi:hypothetical protein ELBI_79 [Anabaena phage Elbi]|nr:hypothetical protein ELBI_30 [Anabaena phage Elbi]QVQ57084.1 hypothetical protein ELBI_79 [Anabaena phage Elbi]